jgi:hypothetical protein
MVRSSVALAGLVFVAGCTTAPVSPGAYSAPVYVNPMPYSHIDPEPFMNHNEPWVGTNTTCYTIGTNVNCRTY